MKNNNSKNKTKKKNKKKKSNAPLCNYFSTNIFVLLD